MYEKYENAYYASEIADFLQKELMGENCIIYEPRSVNSLKNNSIIFVDNVWCKDFNYSKLNDYSDVLVITNREPDTNGKYSLILTENPRLDFIKMLNKFFVRLHKEDVHPTAIISESANCGKNVTIGANVFIGPDVTIGENTAIHQNVVISGRVKIGKRCVIKANATIGSEGYSFIFDEKGQLEHFPQIGGIIIGDDVWIGANTTVENAALDDTIINNGVKIDDLVQVGHNSVVGENTQVTAGVIICGCARIGRKCWIAPNATIDNGVIVADNSTVAMGAVVLNNIPESSVAAGVPAKVIKKIN